MRNLFLERKSFPQTTTNFKNKYKILKIFANLFKSAGKKTPEKICEDKMSKRQNIRRQNIKKNKSPMENKKKNYAQFIFRKKMFPIDHNKF